MFLKRFRKTVTNSEDLAKTSAQICLRTLTRSVAVWEEGASVWDVCAELTAEACLACNLSQISSCEISKKD